jgi:F-type H+-transporting ATPase subunit delta
MSGASSREALANLRAYQDGVLRAYSTPETLTSLAAELYQVADLLTGQPRLRRLLGDPATPAEARAGLVTSLLQGKISPTALETTQAAVRERWSTPWDLADGLERSADDALLTAADRQGALDEVEDELFRFERILDAEGELVTILDEVTVPAERRVNLLDRVLSGKVHPVTQALLQHAVRSQRRRSVTFVIDDLLAEAAARQERSLARVISAVPLTAEQLTRLGAVLAQLYGRAMSIRTAVDPSVKGGLVIRVGDEIIDGSVASRLAQARTALAG